MEAERSYGAALKQEPRNAEALRELKSVSEVRKLVERGDEAMRAVRHYYTVKDAVCCVRAVLMWAACTAG
jgi:hypothetical protein